MNEPSRRYWISWCCSEDDYRPVSYPPHDAICGWWCSGVNADDNAILCAVVDAENEIAATASIFTEWPEAREYVREYGWRFIESRRTDWKPGDRFPLREWMIDRINRTHQAMENK